MIYESEFIFLVQGRESELKSFTTLKTPNSKVITLSWDTNQNGITPYDHHYFLPNSTWAEGRNFLLTKAINLYSDYKYLIFLDGDMYLQAGKIEEFLNFLKTYEPVLGLPLSTQIKDSNRYLPESEVQTQTSFDQIMQAYSRRAVEDRICLPYITDLDHLSWWYSCELNQYLTTKYYERETLQFNNFIIENTHHPAKDVEETGGSKYVGGITKDGLKQCKQIVEKKFGKQGYLIGTLFHPKIIPRPVNINSNILNLFVKDQKWTIKRILRICLYVLMLIYANILKAVFRGRYPKQTVLVYKQQYS